MVPLYSGGAPLGTHILPSELVLTVQGVRTFSFVLFRAMDSLGIATIFLWSTPWATLTRALTKLGLSEYIVMVLDFTYRYLILFLPLVEEYLLGRKSRIVGREAYTHKLSWIGMTLANFYRLTTSYGEDLHMGLQSRGFTGMYQRPMRWLIGGKEWVYLAVCCIIFGIGALY